MSIKPASFEDASRIIPITSHSYRAHIHPDWSYGPGAHGGFLMVLVWKTVTAHFRTTLANHDLPDTVAFHVELLRPGMVGEATLYVKDVRSGKGSSTVHVSLVQEGKEKVVGYVTNINRSKAKGLSVPINPSINPTVPTINFKDVLEHRDPSWIRFEVEYIPKAFNHALSQVTFALLKNPPADQAIQQQWICQSDQSRCWTTDMLGLVVDHFVPPVENFFPESPHNSLATAKRAMDWAAQGLKRSSSGWKAPRRYPLVSASIDIKRKLPPEGVKWLYQYFRVRGIEKGWLDVHCEVWDEERRLIAVSQQVWQLVEIKKEMVGKVTAQGLEKGFAQKL